MKKVILFVLCVSSFVAFSQAFSQDSTKTTKHKKRIYNEIGVNASLLLRQAFGSSSSSITPLPYNLTYKLIAGKWAARVGFGININNTSTTNYSYGGNYYYNQNPPDQMRPNYTNSTAYFYRAGAEYRFRVSRKLLVYGGIDIVGQASNGKTQYNYMNNNLPNNYDYTLSNSTTTGSGFGVGPVIGIQFYCTRRFSIYTEIPLYYMKTTQNVKTTQFENSLNSSSQNFYQYYSGSTHNTTTSAFSITIPATLYIAIKF